jgi:uncharacterized protein GlcG (DUF336 family)
MLQERMLGSGIRMDEAHKIVEAMLKEAMKDPERPMAFAVVDTSGTLVYFARMDGGSGMNSRMAINKAYTCIDTRRDTLESENILKKTGRDIAVFGELRYAALQGGVCIRSEDGSIVGAVGTSGRWASEDEELARIGAKAYYRPPKT